jgi:hypothetical protein
MTWKTRVGLIGLAAALAAPRAAVAQQRPLLTEDPETIGAGVVLLEGGFDYQKDILYTTSGLKGNLIRVPTLGVNVGLSSIAELQFDWSAHDRLAITDRQAAPLADLVTATGDRTTSVGDLVIATKIRVMSETAGRPAIGVRFATKLPNASNESGLGLDTTDFLATALVGKTIQSIRVVGNVGLGILGDPTKPNNQNDVLLYGLSVARAIAQGVEVVGEVNGRASTRSGTPAPGTESRAVMRVGARYTHGAGRVDAGVILGMTSRDPSVGFTFGYTYAFNAFRVP